MKIIIFLFGLGFAIKFNIVGSISLSELFLICASPIYLPRINWQTREMSTILSLYVSLFLFQLISELIVGNTLPSAMKGLAITVVSFLHFSFLFRYLCKDLSLLPILLFSLAVSQFIMGPDSILEGEQVTISDLTERVGSVLLKFYIAPIVINILLALSIIVKWRKFVYVIIFLSVVFVALGVRSSGLVLFITGFVSLLVDEKPKMFTKNNILKGSLITIILVYTAYCIYVSLVLSGKIETGNSNQLLRCEQPYNPIELLLRGRAEVWVGWKAFMDSFFFGHGAWAYDRTGTYLNLLLKTQHVSEYVGKMGDEMYLIPSHSVIIGAGMMNGVFAFVSMLLLIFFFIKRAIFAILKVPYRYRIVLLSFLFSLAWNAVFSPMSHFRLTLPLYCVGIYIFHRKFVKKRKILVRTSITKPKVGLDLSPSNTQLSR